MSLRVKEESSGERWAESSRLWAVNQGGAWRSSYSLCDDPLQPPLRQVMFPHRLQRHRALLNGGARKHKRGERVDDVYPPQLRADGLLRGLVSVDFIYGRLPELHPHQTDGLLGDGVLHLVEYIFFYLYLLRTDTEAAGLTDVTPSWRQPGWRNTCLCQLHVKGSQSQRGAPRLLWEQEGGHEAVIVSGPEEQEHKLSTCGSCCSSKAPVTKKDMKWF